MTAWDETTCVEITEEVFAGLVVRVVRGPNSGRWQREAHSFILCPHGERVPLDASYDRLPKLTRGQKADGARMLWEETRPNGRTRPFYGYCPTCETQRAEGEAQDERVRAIVKPMKRPTVPPSAKRAYKAAREAFNAGALEDFGLTDDGRVWTQEKLCQVA